MRTKQKYKEKGMAERGSERDKEGVRGRGGRIGGQ